MQQLMALVNRQPPSIDPLVRAALVALIKAEITVLKWMLGFLVVGMVSLLFKALAV